MSEDQKTIEVLTRTIELLLNLKESANKLSPSLAKSLDDQPWDYMIGLRDRRTIRFKGAKMDEGSEWITLMGVDGISSIGGDNGDIEMSDVDHGFPRGLDVRISDIMWAADAPDGS